MQKNDIVRLKIIDMTTDGSGIGKYEGMAVFVPLSAVGDIINARILKVKKTYAYGKIEEILVPSNNRIDNTCNVFNRCGGCVYRHISYESECEIKQNKVESNINRIGGIPLKAQPIIFSNKINNYRNKAQFPINKDGHFGFYAKHSHSVIPCEECALQPKIFDEILRAVHSWIEEYKIKIYDEKTHSGLFRHLYLRIGDKTGEIMVVAVINGEKLPFAEQLINKLLTVCGDAIKSIQININKDKTNVILGAKCKTLYGENYINDIICGVKIRISPNSFYQVNRDMAEVLYMKANEYANAYNKNILDLYCGVGTIGLSMAKYAKSVVGVEVVPQAINDANKNAQNNNIENARFICADAAQAAKILAAEAYKPDVVIIDPPRKGCDADLIHTISKSFAPQRVVYVSCDSATLARDLVIFSELGYSLIEYTPIDLFPRTSHIETVALLKKVL